MKKLTRSQSNVDYKGLNDDRATSLEFVRVLFDLPREQMNRPAYQFLAGAAYCLWRAVFMRDADSTWKAPATSDPLGNGLPPHVHLLQGILDDNAVTYPLEKRCRDWFVGFYLNSAEVRLRLVATRLKAAADRNPTLLDFWGHMESFFARSEEEVPRPGWGKPADRFARCIKVAHHLLEVMQSTPVPKMA